MASERPCQSADERPDISDDHLNWTPRKRPWPAAMPVNPAVRTLFAPGSIVELAWATDILARPAP